MIIWVLANDPSLMIQPNPAISTPQTYNNPDNSVNLGNPPDRLALPVSIGILASGSGSNLEAIANTLNNATVAGLNPDTAKLSVVVYNNPNAYVQQRAQKLSIPAVLCNHREYDSREQLDAAIIEVFQQYQVDLVVMAGWMRIVTDKLINAYPRRILNIHPSLLPSFPGAKAIVQALAYGVKITGCTVHIAIAEVDAGPILQQAAVPVLPNDTLETLHQRIQVQEHIIYPQAIADYIKLLSS
ncbi:formyltetrahydrofolate-dependent phosphoribosylglycinamide formyltransferase [Thalassoporum mexicanum PCC 7367]|nr:formyltetrahydrofolate-dependent phosphoribosylglycinamide formyltransferase [Pseudanabaena sp. PCC 7367]